ncbi:MAG: cob(I)yrinic acid a,c-diamide adenosyltransferase [Tannerellaceae bacterium]
MSVALKIYTRGGDKGRTGIHGGGRVEKDDIRIEANGTLDELNAEIGIVRALLSPEHDWQPILEKIQRELMTVMSLVATPSAIRTQNPNVLPTDLAAFCEGQIDLLTGQMEDNGYFILPGGTLVSAHLQLARTFVRRAERRLWTLHRADPIPPDIMQFVNRLSDLFFTMARYELFREGNAEERWHSFLYKRNKKESEN